MAIECLFVRDHARAMGDDQYRGLLTEREREILRGDADVADGYRRRVRSRVRSKIELVGDDLQLLDEHDADLAADLRDSVCDG